MTRLLATTALALWLGASCTRAQAPDQVAKPVKKRPNIVLIVADDQAWTDFGFMGHKMVQTPAIDALAAKSASFVNGYVPTSLCRASLATLLTGQYAHQHCICFNDPPKTLERTAAHPFIARSPALPRILASVGYRSFQTGKFWEGHYANAGFTDGMTVKGRHGDTGLTIGRDTMAPIADFLDQSAGQPFFLWYAPMLPHTPHNPPAIYVKAFAEKGLDPKTQAYYATIRWFDDSVAALMKLLSDRHLDDNTAIVFLVDNGWAVPLAGERMAYAVKSKNSPFDGGLRTPLLIHWPGHTKSGMRQDLVSSIDVVPTLLDIAGLNYAARGLPGLSLLNASSVKTEKIQRDTIFGELFLHTASQLGQPKIDMTYRWVRRGDWKLILPTPLAVSASKLEKGGDPQNLVINPTDGPFLYNLRDDPTEQKNLAADPAQSDRLQSLTQALDQWLEDR
ncbi:MAG: sulfatase [Planctomycetota bacterium]|nr:MAG: sulfatase [Planctomycetota bacterium]